MRTIHYMLAFAGLFVLICCKDKSAIIVPATSSTIATFKLGQERTLSIEGKNSATINIRLRDIKEGRCAEKNCSSCYGGYVRVYFDASNESFQDSLILSRISCVQVDNPSFDNPLVDQKNFHGLHIGLANITDYTGDNSKNNYSVQLLIQAP